MSPSINKRFAMKKIIISILLGLSTFIFADGASIYANCAGCHGVKGTTKALEKSAIIAGQDSSKTIKQLKAYRAGKLNQYGMGSLMKANAQAFSLDDASIKAVANYISSLK